jgi:sn-glycerol 3-phosphate transport system substrate-binding protein
MVNNDNGRSAPATEANLDTPEARSLMQWLADMNDEGLLNPFPVTEGSIDHYLALITQDSSMLIETSTAAGTIAQALGGEITAEDAGIDLDIDLEEAEVVPGSAQLPGIEEPGQVAPSGGNFYLLNVGEPAEQAGAYRFLRFMLEPENSKRWHIEGGYLPVVQEVVDDPDVQEFQETDLGGILLAPSAEQMAAADPDRVAPLIGPFTSYKDVLQGAMESVLFGGTDPETALANAEEEMNQALEDYNQ